MKPLFDSLVLAYLMIRWTESWVAEDRSVTVTCEPMRCRVSRGGWRLTTLFSGFCLVAPCVGHATRLQPVDDASVLSFARTASVRALTFRQGVREGFTGARAAFTETAWAQFVRVMEGWLDQNGAPTFNSSFIPSGEGAVVDRQNDVVHVRFLGVLTQSQNLSRTTYRVVVDVWAGGRPLNVQRLTQTTCGGASASKGCG